MLAAVAALAATLSSADPLRSPACISALRALTLVEDAAMRAPPAPQASASTGPAAPALLAARRAAAEACLGTADASPAPTRQQAPVAIERITLPAARGGPAPLPAPASAPPPVRQQPPHMVTVCDADGCWTNEGIRLQRQGSMLLGPRGPCMQIGAVLNCP